MTGVGRSWTRLTDAGENRLSVLPPVSVWGVVICHRRVGPCQSM